MSVSHLAHGFTSGTLIARDGNPTRKRVSEVPTAIPHLRACCGDTGLRKWRGRLTRLTHGITSGALVPLEGNPTRKRGADCKLSLTRRVTIKSTSRYAAGWYTEICHSLSNWRRN